MIKKFVWLIVIVIYLYCLFYNPEIKEKFNNVNEEIRKNHLNITIDFNHNIINTLNN